MSKKKRKDIEIERIINGPNRDKALTRLVNDIRKLCFTEEELVKLGTEMLADMEEELVVRGDFVLKDILNSFMVHDQADAHLQRLVGEAD